MITEGRKNGNNAPHPVSLSHGGERVKRKKGGRVNIYTIGHRNHKWEFFLGLLKQNEIEMVIDVRAVPRSRFAPWANKALGEALGAEGHKVPLAGGQAGRTALFKAGPHA